MVAPSYGTVWASILAFACILFVLGLLLCIPFMLARLRGTNARVDRIMDSMARAMGADPPANQKSDKQPATKQFLRSLKVTKYASPDDVEAAAEDCCAICCCEYEAGQPVIKLSCSHMFHKECIHAWLKVDAVCPICKTNLWPQAPPCQCPHAQHIPPLAAPAPAATAPTAPAAAPGTVEAVGALSQAAGATLQMGVRSAGLAAAIPASAARCTPASPRALSPAWQQHSLGSPVLGAAGVSP